MDFVGKTDLKKYYEKRRDVSPPAVGVRKRGGSSEFSENRGE